MSGANRLFLADLQAVDRRMRAPVPGRTRVLSELEADLEELTAHLLSGGLAPEEARRRAIEMMVPDAASLEALDRLHAAPLEWLARRVPHGRLRRIEQWVFLASALAVLVAVVVVLRDVDLLRHASPFLLPIVALGSVLAAVAARAAFLVLVRFDVPRGARWTTATGVLAVALMALGTVGSILDLHAIAGQIASDPTESTTLVVVALQRVGAVGAVTLVLSLVAGLAWLAARHRVLVLATRHARAVGAIQHSDIMETES